jgi:hypothetical protein
VFGARCNAIRKSPRLETALSHAVALQNLHESFAGSRVSMVFTTVSCKAYRDAYMFPRAQVDPKVPTSYACTRHHAETSYVRVEHHVDVLETEFGMILFESVSRFWKTDVLSTSQGVRFGSEQSDRKGRRTASSRPARLEPPRLQLLELRCASRTHQSHVEGYPVALLPRQDIQIVMALM